MSPTQINYNHFRSHSTKQKMCSNYNRESIDSPSSYYIPKKKTPIIHKRQTLYQPRPQTAQTGVSNQNKHYEKGSKSHKRVFVSNIQGIDTSNTNSMTTSEMKEMLKHMVANYTGMEKAKKCLEDKGMTLPGDDHVFQISGTVEKQTVKKPKYHEDLKKITKLDEEYYIKNQYTESPIFAKVREFENFVEFSKKVREEKIIKRKTKEYPADDMAVKSLNRRMNFINRKCISFIQPPTHSFSRESSISPRKDKNLLRPMMDLSRSGLATPEEVEEAEDEDVDLDGKEEKEEKAKEERQTEIEKVEKERRFTRGREIIATIFKYVGLHIFERCAEKSLDENQRKLRKVLGISAVEMKKRNSMAKVMLGNRKRQSKLLKNESLDIQKDDGLDLLRSITAPIKRNRNMGLSLIDSELDKLLLDQTETEKHPKSMNKDIKETQKLPIVTENLNESELIEEETVDFLDFIYEFEGVKQKKIGKSSELFGSLERRNSVSKYIQKVSQSINLSFEEFRDNIKKYKEYDGITYFERYITTHRLPATAGLSPIPDSIITQELSLDIGLEGFEDSQSADMKEELEEDPSRIIDEEIGIIPPPCEISGSSFSNINHSNIPDINMFGESCRTGLTEQMKKIHTISTMYHYITETFQSLSPSAIVANENEIGMKDLSTFSLYLVREELSKKMFNVYVDYLLLQNIVKKLKFFAGFDELMRIKILQAGEYKFFTKGEYVFRQGDLGDSMYVILHGSAYIKVQNMEIPNSKEHTVNTLFDGFSFGEQSLIQSQYVTKDLKRNASVVAAEDTDFLMISRQTFNDIIFKEIKNDLHAKIKFLKHCKYFNKIKDPYALVIMALNVKIKKFKFGDIIVKQGRIPEEGFVIIEGQTKVVYDHIVSRPKNAFIPVAKYNRKMEKPFRFSIKEYHNIDLKKSDIQIVDQRMNTEEFLDDENLFNNQSYQDDIKTKRPQTANVNNRELSLKGLSKVNVVNDDSYLRRPDGIPKLEYTDHVIYIYIYIYRLNSID